MELIDTRQFNIWFKVNDFENQPYILSKLPTSKYVKLKRKKHLKFCFIVLLIFFFQLEFGHLFIILK